MLTTAEITATLLRITARTVQRILLRIQARIALRTVRRILLRTLTIRIRISKMKIRVPFGVSLFT